MIIIEKIRELFKRIFCKKLTQLDEKIENNNNNFKSNIIVEPDKERERLLKMQKDFRVGLVKEEKINEKDREKLYALYDEQILEIKKKIKNNKQLTEKYKLEIMRLKVSK